jgi:AraC-like DNA-binding protein
MANAKQMLAETDCSIGEIVEKCGFSDNSNFSRAFRKLTNMSPSDFRKKYKAE